MHQEGLVPCPKCPEEFISEGTLHQHLRQDHPVVLSGSDDRSGHSPFGSQASDANGTARFSGNGFGRESAAGVQSSGQGSGPSGTPDENGAGSCGGTGSTGGDYCARLAAAVTASLQAGQFDASLSSSPYMYNVLLNGFSSTSREAGTSSSGMQSESVRIKTEPVSYPFSEQQQHQGAPCFPVSCSPGSGINGTDGTGSEEPIRPGPQSEGPTEFIFLDQPPPAGSSVGPGATVDYVFSCGNPVPMPNLGNPGFLSASRSTAGFNGCFSSSQGSMFPEPSNGWSGIQHCHAANHTGIVRKRRKIVYDDEVSCDESDHSDTAPDTKQFRPCQPAPGPPVCAPDGVKKERGVVKDDHVGQSGSSATGTGITKSQDRDSGIYSPDLTDWVGDEIVYLETVNQLEERARRAELIVLESAECGGNFL